MGNKWVRRERVLTKEQINEAIRMRDQQNLSKRKLAQYFEVGITTIWENVYSIRADENEKRKFRVHIWREKYRKKDTCIPCMGCEICMTKEFTSLEQIQQRIPLNYQIGDKCITCYLKGLGLHYNDLLMV